MKHSPVKQVGIAALPLEARAQWVGTESAGPQEGVAPALVLHTNAAPPPLPTINTPQKKGVCFLSPLGFTTEAFHLQALSVRKQQACFQGISPLIIHTGNCLTCVLLALG